jgi:drug/metabolite transporter (DMT)-like permease
LGAGAFFGFISCGLFLYIWMFFQAVAAKRLDPRSNAVILYIIGVLLSFGGTSFGIVTGYDHHGGSHAGSLSNIAGIVVIIVGHFNIRSSLESYFNQVERIGLRLSAVMTFFFGTIYLQYHFNRINRWRRTGVLY